MKRKIELLAPGGDIDSIKAAIAAGADAVYCGLDRFNARNRAANLGFEDLNGIINLAHRNNCKVFLTLNIIIVGNEIPALVSLLNKLVNTKIDGVIVQDFGLFYLLSKYFNGLEIHASTQLNTHNEGQVIFLSKLNAVRANLARELNIHEIEYLTSVGHKNNILTEVFVHGSYCISFSGICYLSSVHGGNSGNRGRCSQPCRDRYLTTPQDKNFPLNLKDNSAYSDLRQIADAGVASVKIEGRMKKSDYVYTVVRCWKNQIRLFYNQNRLNTDNSELYKVFNRDFSNAYLMGNLNKDMFVDNPRDHSVMHLDAVNYSSENIETSSVHEKKEAIAANVKNIINRLSIAKTPLIICVSGKAESPLTVSVKTPTMSFIVKSETDLLKAGLKVPKRHHPDRAGQAAATAGNNNPETKNRKFNAQCLDYDFLLERFKALNDTEFYIRHLDVENLQPGIFIPFNALTAMKNRILSVLTGSKDNVDPIDVPFLKKQRPLETRPALGVLISSQKDLSLYSQTAADIYFQLPNCFKKEGVETESSKLFDLFLKNRKLIPWFPSVLIGEDYSAAVDFLQHVQPNRIVTNNTGIAYEAFKMGIPWIAGPYLNVVNSFSLLCLKEKFNCSGAFISNEISKYQIKSIIRPENFKLYYSIYYPVLLLSSRQCLLQPVIGCEKNRVTDQCIQTCNKSASITNLKKVPFFIKKTKGNYHCVYNNHNFLNTDIVKDIPGFFSSFLIDLRDVTTETNIEMGKTGIMALFENLLNGDPDSENILKQMIHPTTNIQYQKGI